MLIYKIALDSIIRMIGLRPYFCSVQNTHMRRIIFVTALLSVTSTAIAQEDWRLYRNTGPDSTSTVGEGALQKGDIVDRTPGEIRYIQDERIAILDDYLKSNPKKHDGYRIQLVFGSRGSVSGAKAKYNGLHNYPAYETYLPPNFRLRVGDFMTRFEAEKALRDIKGEFSGAYIVRDKIEVPVLYR